MSEDDTFLLGTINYIPGKMYRVIRQSGLPTSTEENVKSLGSSTNYGGILEYDKLFMFVGVAQYNLSIFSKILVDDKVILTYNPYSLQNFTSSEQE